MKTGWRHQRCSSIVRPAAWPVHLGSLVTDASQSPHRHLDRIKAELYFGIADNDAMATPEQMVDLEKALRDRQITINWNGIPARCTVSCALPYIVGYTPGLSPESLKNSLWHSLTLYAQGKLEGVPEFAPPGGANFMTCRSVAEAMLGALERGESGKSYLVGDANLTWKEFFELWFKAAGRPRDLEVRAGHPIIPDYARSYLDYGKTDYEPAAVETALLGYQRGVLVPQIQEFYEYFASMPER